MEKAELLDLIRNRITLPRTLIQVLERLHPQCCQAIEEIDRMMREIEEDHDETSHQ